MSLKETVHQSAYCTDLEAVLRCQNPSSLAIIALMKTTLLADILG